MNVNEIDKHFLSLSQASEILGLTYTRIRQMLKEGKLSSIKVLNKVFIPKDDINREIKLRAKTKASKNSKPHRRCFCESCSRYCEICSVRAEFFDPRFVDKFYCIDHIGDDDKQLMGVRLPFCKKAIVVYRGCKHQIVFNDYKDVDAEYDCPTCEENN